MELTEFLEAIRECPDDRVNMGAGVEKEREVARVTAEYGIFDNWLIELRGDRRQFIQRLLSANWEVDPKYTLLRVQEHKGCLIYTPGTVVMQLFAQRKDRDYFGLSLHPYQNSKIEGTSWEKAIAIAVGDIGKIMIDDGIPGCFPKSRGWKDLNNLDQIIHYEPEK
tara:strand:+ start:59 stop:556 length:498 start_codon:yes stop_codon:yes gene_type:complete